MKQIFNLKSMFLGCLAAFSLSAVAEDMPKILTVQPLYSGALSSMSQNGLWAVGDAVNPANSVYTAFPRIVNTTTGETTELFTAAEAQTNKPMGATCVSNDGKVVGGSIDNVPAVWKEGTGWKKLTLPLGRDCNTGTVSAITPDGKYAVGRVGKDLYMEYPMMWDLEKNRVVSLPNMINKNPMYQDRIEEGMDPADWKDEELNVRLTGITPDANVLIGTVDFPFPQASWDFIYYRDKQQWYPIGLQFENDRLRPLNGNISGANECVLSSDGKYFGGICMDTSEGSAQFTCPINEPENFTIHGDGDGFGVWAIGSDGVVYGSTPVSTPVRNWSAKVGKYWYDWKSVLKQLYGIDWLNDITKDDLGLSGTVEEISADNLTILASDYAQGYSYIIKLPAPLTEICKDVDLLGDYRIFPIDGAEFSKIRTIVLDMGRPVEIKGQKTSVTLYDGNGNALRNTINVAVQPDNNTRVDVTFRDYNLEPGKSYSVKVPAGVICIAGDAERTNKEITVNYRGRESGPVKPVSIAPDNGASVARINLSTNPITIDFNAQLTAGETPRFTLYQVKDGKAEFLYDLTASVSDRTVTLYPISEQRLAEGTDYRIDFGAGSVCDLSGDGANEAFSITYHGSYVPEIDPSSNIIFSDDFSNGVAGMMLYEGDNLTPTQEMIGYDFDANSRPWVPETDEHELNYAAASHSCYDPAGKSNDWMVTPQLYIPDDKVTLSFKAQSFRAIKNDVLKVYVWENPDVVTILTASAIDQIRYNTTPVFSERLSPGKSEDTLAGDWVTYTVPLDKYAGKYIYIAFVNDNQNQSMIFVDDILVTRDVPATLSIDTERMMVDEDKVRIRGRLSVMKAEGIDGYKVTLADSEGNQLDEVTSDAHLDKDQISTFSFSKNVDLEKGAVNTFIVTFSSGNDKIEYKFDISNLLFDTTKRILLEEMTGYTCQFCPQGILAMEYLEESYGDLLIPIEIHSYTGDTFGGSEQSAYSSFLGFSGAPQGRLGRGSISAPMYSNGVDYTFTSPNENTWVHKAAEVIEEMALADIDVNSANIDMDNRKVYVDATVKAAINLNNTNINVFGVMLEDGLIQFQTNGLFNIDAPGLKEWGKGGRNGQESVPHIYNNVVRGTSAVETAGVYSGFNGKGGYIPTDIKAGDPIDFTYEFKLPTGISDINKTKVCLIMIDANTGEYINSAISGYASTAVEGISADEAEFADVYDLAGRIVMRNASVEDLGNLEAGIYIRAGKKFIKH